LNNKTISFMKNMSYTFTSNLIALIVSTLVILIIPKLIGIEEYGYLQLYMFYSAYVGFMHFGWNDGIYLRYGGDNYKDLDKKLFFSQFIMLLISQISIALIILFVSNLFIINVDRSFIIRMVAISLIIVNMRIMLLFILQSTNRIREYAKITMADRVIYITLIITFLLFGIRDYKILIVADLIGKGLSLTFAIISCKEIVLNKLRDFHLNFKEMFTNINVGIKLMIANIGSMLIIGIVRFGIERNWDVATFGKISLTLSISNMTMIFINAVGIILFPLLRRTNKDKLSYIYFVMRDFLLVLLLGFLITYYPLKVLLSVWLPQYSGSFIYMALLFPIVVFEGKMALLINTYLKTLREEKTMLWINVLSMFLSLVLTFVTTQLFNNLDLTVISIVVLLAIRSVVAEVFLAKKMKINIKKDIIYELVIVTIFMSSGWFINSIYSMLVYSIAYIVYILLKRRDIKRSFESMKKLIKS